MTFHSPRLLFALLPWLLVSCVTQSEPALYDTVQISKGCRESHFQISGVPVISKEKGQTLATIKQGSKGIPYSVYWPAGLVPEPAKSYQFEYLKAEITRNSGERPWTDVEILRIKDGDKILVDKSICPLHQAPMARQVEEDVSAPDYSAYYLWTYRQAHCPNDGRAYLTCDSGISHLRWKCPACYKIAETWEKKHGTPKG
ncbi:MAG: hypothetical protein JWO82_3968 [Akkermansiaceae bacterium]|nr:hypothetical protein [Akkermansiaceae bacterium]